MWRHLGLTEKRRSRTSLPPPVQALATISPWKPPPANENLDNMAQHLKDKYEGFEMRPLPWMDDIRISIEKHYVDLELHTKTGTTPIQLDELFKEKLKKPLLIEAPAGYGKTTLAYKILYDWSLGKEYINHFDLALVLPLRYMEGDVKTAIINNFIELYGVDEDTKEGILLDEKLKILLIFDGADEASDNVFHTIIPFVRNTHEYKHFEVVFTSRPGKFRLTPQLRTINYDRLSDVAYNHEKYFSEVIGISGISEKNQKQFLRHVFQSNVGKILTNFKTVAPPELLRCPLFLVMAVLVFTNNNCQNIATKTALLKEVINFTVQRCISKCKGNIGNFEILDMFLDIDDINQNNPFIGLCKNLGKECVRSLNNDEHYLEDGRRYKYANSFELVEYFSKLGLFMISESQIGLSRKTFYEPIHRSFMEFLSAYSLWLTHGKSVAQFTSVVQTLGSLLPSEGSQSSLLFSFLIGLLQGKSTDLLEALKCFSLKISLSFSMFLSPLFELSSRTTTKTIMSNSQVMSKLSKSSLRSLHKLYPMIWNLENFTKNEISRYQTALQTALGHSQSPVKLMRSSLYIPTNIHLDRVEVLVTKIRDKSSITYGRMSCNTLQVKCVDAEPKVFCKVLHEATMKITFSNLHIYLDESCNVLRVLEELINMKDFKVYFLICEITQDFVKAMKKLTSLVKLERLEGLQLWFQDHEGENLHHRSQKLFHTFVTALGKSQLVSKLYLVWFLPLKIQLKMDDLCRKGKKSWEMLDFWGVRVISSTSQCKWQFEILTLFTAECEYAEKALSFLQHSQVRSFALPNEVIAIADETWLRNMVSSQLKLLVDNDLTTTLQKLRRYSTIVEILELYFFWDTMLVAFKDFEAFFASIANSLKVLSMFCIENNLDMFKHILKKVLSNENDRNQSLCVPSQCSVILHIASRMPFTNQEEKLKVDNMFRLFPLLKKGLTTGIISDVQFICARELLVDLCHEYPKGYTRFQKVFPEKEGYVINADIWGTDPKDLEGQFVVRPYNCYRFRIRVKYEQSSVKI